MDQSVLFHPSTPHPNMSSMTCQRRPDKMIKVSKQQVKFHLKTKVIILVLRIENHTIFLPVKSAAAFTLPRRCIFDANWVVIILPLAAEIRLNNASATTLSLIVLPGDSIFVESLIIWAEECIIKTLSCIHDEAAGKISIIDNSLNIIEKEKITWETQMNTKTKNIRRQIQMFNLRTIIKKYSAQKNHTMSKLKQDG